MDVYCSVLGSKAVDFDALEKLVKLRDSGALSEIEFHYQKALIASEESNVEMINNKNKYLSYPLLFLYSTVIIISWITFWYFNDIKMIYYMNVKSDEEKICQISIKSNLLNPETVEFFEFLPVHELDYISQYKSRLTSELSEEFSYVGRNFTGLYSDVMESSKESIISRNVMEAADKERLRLKEKDLKTFSYRFKSDGKLGNTITSTEYCAVGKSICECI